MDKYILGVDPGFADMGVALLRLGKTSDQDDVVGMWHVSTTPSSKKSRVLAADDNTDRLRCIAASLRGITDRYAPTGVSLVTSESLSAARNAASSAKVASAWGVVVAQAEVRSLPILQTLPQPLKLLVAGTKTASKTEVQQALRAKYPRLESKLFSVQQGVFVDKAVPAGKLEHPYDALAAIVACLHSDLVRMMRA